jgi:hypothetical protein
VWDGYVRRGFHGLQNFVTVLTRWPYDERFWGAITHDTLFFVLTFAIQTTLGLFVAVLLAKKWRGFAYFQAAYFLPVLGERVVGVGVGADAVRGDGRAHGPGRGVCAAGLAMALLGKRRFLAKSNALDGCWGSCSGRW